MEREGASVPALGTEARGEGPVPTGPKTLLCRAFPTEPPAATRTNFRVGVDIQTRLQSAPFENRRGRERA